MQPDYIVCCILYYTDDIIIISFLIFSPKIFLIIFEIIIFCNAT